MTGEQKERPVPRMPETGVSGVLGRKVLTVRELSDYLRVHPSTVYRLLRQRRLPAFRIGSDWRFDPEAIDRWMCESSQ